jgi:Ca-activated chloride channel family protein
MGTLRPRRGPLAVATAFALLLTGALAIEGRQPSAADCLSVVLASSEEKSTLLGQVAVDYQKATHPSVDGRCVSIRVDRVASGQAEQALANGWNETSFGPRPDVWSPAALTWTLLLSRDLANRGQEDLVPQGVRSLFKSPLVIGTPKPMADALGWPSKAIGWSDILELARGRVGWSRFGHPEWGAFQLGKTNPTISTSGLHALIGAYFAASGRSSDLTVADLEGPAVVDFVRQVESSVVHYGDSVSTFLLNLQAADDANAALSYVSAVAVEEKEVWDYNQGNPRADPTQYGTHLPPRVPLVAIYPKEGTLAADHPYVILRGSWVSDAKRRAAQDFLNYLEAPSQQLRFQAVGFRDQFGQPGPQLSTTNGFQPERPSAYLQPPAAEVIQRMEKVWKDLRKRAKVLLLLDTSFSTSGGDAGSLATSLAVGLNELASEDQIASWEFNSNLAGSLPYRQALPFAPVSVNRSAIEAEVGALRPTNKAADLNHAVLAAIDAMRQNADPTRINAVVVVTNGRSTSPGDLDPATLLRELQAASETAGVHVFTVAYGSHPDATALGLMARASRGATYDATARPGGVFSAVVSNF